MKQNNCLTVELTDMEGVETDFYVQNSFCQNLQITTKWLIFNLLWYQKSELKLYCCLTLYEKVGFPI